jgi:hypothetical protein
MTNLTNAQTELLKYLHSQISETSKQRNAEVSKLSIWNQAKEEDSADMEAVIDYEINKAKLNIESLNLRFQWLVEQMNEFVPEALK